MPKDTLLARIRDRSATVAVLGLGYVGLPLAVGFAQAGFRTLGLDVDADKVERLNAGESYIADVPASTVAALVRGGRLSAGTDFARLQECDAVSICVPTPLSKTHDPDLSYVVAAAESIAAHVHAGMLIVLESTTYPGTTEEIVVPRLLHNGLQVGTDVFVAFSPERIDPGRSDYTLANTPKVMGGVTPACLEVATALYGAVVERLVPVSSTQAAEMVKLLENTFRAVNIALVNEVLLMCDRLGLDAWEIIEAAATKPYGFMKFTPGPGVGGHCLDGNETVRYRWGRANGVMRLADLYALAFERSRRTFEHLGGSFVAPRGLEVLSIDPATGAQSWQPVTYLFAREYAGTLVDVETSDHRRLTVTDRHPMLVHADGALVVREALALQPGDLLPLAGSGQRRGLLSPVTPVLRAVARREHTRVYSVEVGGTHTFATTADIYVHNCIPLDPHYLSWKLRTLNYNARFIQLASEINTAMPVYWVTRVAEALNEDGLAVKGARVLVLGVTYKRDVGDIRESPAIDIIELLEARGARVSFHDPFVPSLAGEGLATPAVELTPEAVAGADCVVIVTDHSSYDWAWLQANARRIVDTRNALRRLATLGARV
jgi:UDP-N-acetyl-D-mannosaminuronate dehydrogenase